MSEHKQCPWCLRTPAEPCPEARCGWWERKALPAPIRPRRHARTARATRADNIRKWLAFGPVPLMELAVEMRCTRFALRRTLDTMADVHVTYTARRVAVVGLRAGQRHQEAA